jgi:CxxC-x17-CxxC domain-containing protein
VGERRRVRVNIKENELLQLIAVADIAAESLLGENPEGAAGSALLSVDDFGDGVALVYELAAQARRAYIGKGEAVPSHVAEALANTRRPSSTEFQHKMLTCIDCGADFVFTAGEQLFFHDKQFKNTPKRCKSCKGKRVAILSATALPGGTFNYARAETHAVCSQCGKETTVPFRPTGGRPIFCRECFSQRRNNVASA